MWTIIRDTFFNMVVALIKCQGDWASNPFERLLETKLHDHLIGNDSRSNQVNL